MINFVSKKKIYFIISAAVILIGIVSFIFQGFNFDIDFTGGTAMDIKLHTEYTHDVENDLKTIVKNTTGMDAQIQKTGNGDEAYIRTPEINTEQRDALYNAIADKYNLDKENKTDLVSADNVGQTMSKTLLTNALYALIGAILLMLVYIIIRFNFASGLSSVTALIHDVLVMLTIYTVFQLPIGSSFIAAALTIVGYSINATIIVFDRVREERKREQNFELAVNRGINKSITRAIYTSLTTLFTIGMLYILGVDSIRDFALPIIIGIFAGAYSSLCLAGSLWTVYDGCFKKIGKNKKSKKNASKGKKVNPYKQQKSQGNVNRPL